MPISQGLRRRLMRRHFQRRSQENHPPSRARAFIKANYVAASVDVFKRELEATWLKLV